MKKMSFNRGALIALLVSQLACPVMAQSDDELLDSGQWRDESTGLIWMRCAVGQVWSSRTCHGKSAAANWWLSHSLVSDLSFADQKDWRVPTASELLSLVYCNNGIGRRTVPIPTAQGDVAAKTGCLPRGDIESTIIRPTIDELVFPYSPTAVFHTTSLGANGTAWAIDFNSGDVVLVRPEDQRFIRAVRAGKHDGVYARNLALHREKVMGLGLLAKYSELVGSGSNSAVKAAYDGATTLEKKKYLEAALVNKYLNNILLIRYEATGGADAKAYGGAQGGSWADVVATIFGAKVGTEAQTEISYQLQLDPRTLKVESPFKFSGTAVLTAYGDGYTESHCMWPLPTKCKNSVTQRTFETPISGRLTGNQPARGAATISWTPMSASQTAGGLTSNFVTERIEINIRNVKMEVE